MNKAKTNIFKRLYNWFLNVDIYKNRQEDSNKKFYLIFLSKSLIVFLSLFFSSVFPFLDLLPVIVVSVIILSENSFNRLYYFVLITPFWFVFNYITYVYSLICCLWILKIVRDCLNKKIKLSKRLILIVSALLIYSIFALKFSMSNYWFVIRTICLFLFLFLYKDKIDYKKIVLVFTLAVFYSGILGLIGVLLKNAFAFGTIIYYGGGLFRFCGSVTDPNIFSILCLVVLASVSFLFVNKQICFSLYGLIISAFISFNLITGSKMGFFTMVFILTFVIGVLAFKKDKTSWMQIGIILLILSVCLVIFSMNLQSIFSRLQLEPAQENLSHIEGINFATKHPYLNAILNSSIGKKLSSITTYRFNLWVFYFGVLLDNPINLLFGFGTNKLDFDIVINGQILSQPHNSIVDMVIVYGLIYLLFVAILVGAYCCYKKKRGHKFNCFSILTMITILIGICSISLFWSEIFFLLIILLILPMYEEKGEANESATNK